MSRPEETAQDSAGARRGGGLRLGRRDLLALGAGTAAGAGLAAGGAVLVTRADDDEEGSSTAAPPPPTRRFVSTSLTAPETSTWHRAGATTSAGLLFTTPRSPTFRGVVYDDDAEPVWIEPSGNNVTDLRVQRYRGRPVLTYFTGQILEGLGYGQGVILDERYRTVAEVRAGHGMLVDLHEFQLTSDDTALFVAYPVVPRDLTAIGGSREGWAYGARVQEVDVASGEVLLDVDLLDQIDVDETYRERGDGEGESPDKPFDPVHLNSVEEDGDALLLSARHTGAVYRIDRRSGEIRWRFGGRRTDIPVPDGGEFAWQHDARRQPDGTITLYDNHDSAEESGAVSAALTFEIDEQAMTARLVEALRHADRYGFAMGNAHYLDDGHVVVGWGMDPVATEFDDNGEAVFELRGLGKGSYRSYRSPWRGRPETDPDIGVTAAGERLTVHASWNGATDVAEWRVLAGTDAAALAPVTTVARAGFETTADVDRAAYVLVEALDSDGAVLGTSRALPVPGA